MRNASATERATIMVPGTKNEWLNTNLPTLVVPVSSIAIAPKVVGYVGSTKSPETAANEATRIQIWPEFSGVVIPSAAATAGIITRVVAA